MLVTFNCLPEEPQVFTSSILLSDALFPMLGQTTIPRCTGPYAVNVLVPTLKALALPAPFNPTARLKMLFLPAHRCCEGKSHKQTLCFLAHEAL